MPGSAKIFTTVSIQRNKNSALRIFEKLNSLLKREIPRIYTFGPTLIPFSPWRRWPNLKENNFRGKNSPIGLSKNWRASSPLQVKNRITFCTFWAFFSSKVKGSEWKSTLAYARAMNPEVLDIQRFWSHHFASVTFQSQMFFFYFNPDFQVSSFVAFLCTTHTFLIKISLISQRRI